VVINNLNIRWAGFTFRPSEANTPLFIDTNRMLPFPITLQSLEPVRIEGGQISERIGGIENAKPLLGLPPERLPLANPLAMSELFRGAVTITPDQSSL
jgi:hypothetical protein